MLNECVGELRLNLALNRTARRRRSRAVRSAPLASFVRARMIHRLEPSVQAFRLLSQGHRRIPSFLSAAR